MSKYIIITDPLDVAKQDAITVAFQEMGIGYAHYIPNVWFVVDVDNLLDPLVVRDFVKEIVHDKRVMVIQGDKMQFDGYLAEEEIEWVRTTWEEPQEPTQDSDLFRREQLRRKIRDVVTKKISTLPPGP